MCIRDRYMAGSDIRYVCDQTYETLAAAEAAVVTSGTDVYKRQASHRLAFGGERRYFKPLDEGIICLFASHRLPICGKDSARRNRRDTLYAGS